MIKLNKNTIALGLIAATAITNPLPGQYVLNGLDWAFTQMFRQSAWITLVAAVYMIGLIFYYMWATTPEVKIPPKTKKTPKQKFITT